MASCSSVYGWAGGHNPPAKTPECSKAKHAELVNMSGAMMYEARVKAYAWYCKECRAWGREPEPEQLWFAHANAQCARLLKEFKQNGGNHET